MVRSQRFDRFEKPKSSSACGFAKLPVCIKLVIDSKCSNSYCQAGRLTFVHEHCFFAAFTSCSAQTAAFELPVESPFPRALLHPQAICRVAAETAEGCHKGSGTGSQLSSKIAESWTGPEFDTVSAVQTARCQARFCMSMTY